jgi:hypothetical protein
MTNELSSKSINYTAKDIALVNKEIDIKELEINQLKERIQQLEIQSNKLRKYIDGLDDKYNLEKEQKDNDEYNVEEPEDNDEYNVEQDLEDMIYTLRKSIPKHTISKSIFNTFHALLYDAIIEDVKDKPLCIMYNFIIIEHLVGTRHQEYEIHGHMYLITDKYIYQLCAYNNGEPINRLGANTTLFKIDANGILMSGKKTIGFAPIGIRSCDLGLSKAIKINPYVFHFAEDYLKNSKKSFGNVKKGSDQLILLYEKMLRMRELLIIMFCEI